MALARGQRATCRGGMPLKIPQNFRDMVLTESTFATETWPSCELYVSNHKSIDFPNYSPINLYWVQLTFALVKLTY